MHKSDLSRISMLVKPTKDEAKADTIYAISLNLDSRTAMTEVYRRGAKMLTKSEKFVECPKDLEKENKAKILSELMTEATLTSPVHWTRESEAKNDSRKYHDIKCADQG